MLATSFFWFKKPQDVSTPIIIMSSVTIAEILNQANASEVQHTYKLTPLEFISRQEWSVSIYWAYANNILRKMKLSIFTRHITERPINRIRSDTFFKVSITYQPVACILALAYSAVFVCGWNFSFPSSTEQILWRISSICLLTFPFASVFVSMWYDHTSFQDRSHFGVQPRVSVRHEGNIEDGHEAQEPKSVGGWRRKLETIVKTLRNNSPDRDPLLEAPLRFLLIISALSALYCIARAYVLVADVIEFRQLPESTFETVDWSRYLPLI